MRKLLAAAFLAAFALAPASAADPAVEVRVRAVSDLLDYAEYVGDLAGQGENAKNGAAFLKAISGNPKIGLEGIDTTRAVVGYVVVTPNVVDSPVVLVLPIADEKAFLKLLTDRAGLDPKKNDDGTYRVTVPNAPDTVYFRFANKSVYATTKSTKALEPTELVDPAKIGDSTDDAIATVKLHLDRLPADVKKTVFGQIELTFAELKNKKGEDETAAQTKAKAFAFDAAADAAKMVFDDGKTLAIKLRLAPKTDDITAEVSLSGKPGSALAKTFAAVGNKPGIAGRLPTVANPLFAFGTRIALTADTRDRLKPVIDGLIDEAIEKSDPNGKAFVQEIFDAIAPTLLAGELELGLAASGPDAKGAYGGAFALKMTDGKGLEKILKKYAGLIPEDQVKIDIFEDKINGVGVHKLVVGDENFAKKLGGDTVWLGTSDKVLLASIEPEGKAIRAAIAADAAKVPLASGEVAVARLAQLVEKDLPEERLKELIAAAFGDKPAGRDTVRFSLDGGDALTLKLTAKGKAAKFFVLLGEAKKK